jgi:RecB family exonuclease
MKFFLQEVAKDVYSKHQNEFTDCTLVFPNRRSGIFFRYYLGKLLKGPVWSPRITTISDLMQKFSGLQKADTLSMIFDLYEIYKKEKKSYEPFDEFFFWGEMLLHDFDDIDKYLVEPRDLFKNLASLKSIEDKFSYLTEEQIQAIKRFWDSIDMSNLSDEQQDFVSIWEILYNVYFQFNNILDERQYGYEGKIYRTVVDKLKSTGIDTDSERYIFIGFNALSSCEKQLFHYLKNNKQTTFYWDYDHYYLQSNEAGRFINQNIKEFPGPELDIHNSFNTDKNIHFLNTSYDVAQGKILSELLKNDKEIPVQPNTSAVILPDEHLLLPALNSIPENYESVNVTMGYPVSLTPAYSLLLSLINLQQNSKKENEDSKFYHKDVLAILNHQYLGILRDEHLEKKIDLIRKHNQVYIPAKELRINVYLEHIFQVPGDYKSLSEYLLDNFYNFYRLLKDTGTEDDRNLKLELECIYYVYLAIKRLKEIFSLQEVEIKTETYLRIIERVIETQSIAFQGEPLRGLQVMGILETRALDFENVVILSMNEGTFPKTEASNSFIPYHLRKGFGLPTYELNDAIYAYYFYRIIQRAKNVTLVYNSSNEGVQTGEMSRFMLQLKYESQFNIQEKTVVSDINIPDIKSITVAKSPDVIEKLEHYNTLHGQDKHLSPSGLNSYLRCSLQFYFRYIAEIKEPEELREDIDAPIFGLLFHKAIELIYLDYKNNKVQITDAELDHIMKDKTTIEKHIEQAFRQEYFDNDNSVELSGKHLLVKDIIYQYVQQFLKVEKKFTPFVLIDLEKQYYSDVQFEVDGVQKQVTFRGTIDRIDQNNDGIRVIDYKSGDPKQSFSSIESLFTADGNHAALQALIYSRMYKEFGNPSLDIQPGLYFIRNLYDNFDYHIKMNRQRITYDEVSGELDEFLKSTLNDIFDPQIPFQQTEDEKICRNCPYKSICRRD